MTRAKCIFYLFFSKRIVDLVIRTKIFCHNATVGPTCNRHFQAAINSAIFPVVSTTILNVHISKFFPFFVLGIKDDYSPLILL